MMRRRLSPFLCAAVLATAGAPRAAERGGLAAQAEGQTVVEVEVTGTVSMSPDQVRYRMATKRGQPWRQRDVDNDYQRLATSNLFADVQFVGPQPAPGGVKLTVRVRERDLIRDIRIAGNRQLKAKRLLKLLKAKVGDRVDVGRLNEDRRAIEAEYQKEYYYFATCQYRTEPHEDGVRLVFQVNEGGGRVYVAEVNFRGNSAMPKKDLLRRMQTRPSGFLTRGKYVRETFERDLELLRLFYLQKGYLDVAIAERPFQITAGEARSRWKRRDMYLHVDITEGPQYRVGRVSIEGNRLVREEQIRAILKTMPGQVFDPERMGEDARAIRDVYGLFPNSRYFTRVDARREDTLAGDIVDITFSIDEGPEAILAAIRVHGLKYTREEVVLREFRLFPGEAIDSRKWNDTRRNIRRTGFFKENSVIELVEENSRGRGVAVLELEEEATGKLNFGIGYSTADNIVGTVELSQRNFDYRDWPETWKSFLTGQAFRGGGQDFALNLQKGQKGENYGFSFTNPWIFGKPVSLSLSAFHSLSKYDDEYHEGRTGLEIGLGRRLFGIPDLTGRVAYRLERVNLDHFAGDYLNKPDYRYDQGRHWLNRYITGVAYDTRDSYIDPTRGLLLSANYELAGRVAGGSRDFWRAFLQAQAFLKFYEDKRERPWVLALHADWRLANAYGRTDLVPLSERFQMGGIGTVRGYQYRSVSPRNKQRDPIGGYRAATAGAEIFVPLYEKLIQASVFYDLGGVWNGHTANVPPNDQVDGHGWRQGWGLGLHIKTPLGPMPIRMYYAWDRGRKPGDETQRFQFTFGQVF